MSVLTEWFEGEQVDEQERAHERAYWRRIFTEIGCAVLAGIIVAGISGCASPSPRSEVCYMQLIGRTQDEMPVVRNLCLTEEQFAESQK